MYDTKSPFFLPILRKKPFYPFQQEKARGVYRHFAFLSLEVQNQWRMKWGSKGLVYQKKALRVLKRELILSPFFSLLYNGKKCRKWLQNVFFVRSYNFQCIPFPRRYFKLWQQITCLDKPFVKALSYICDVKSF